MKNLKVSHLTVAHLLRCSILSLGLTALISACSSTAEEAGDTAGHVAPLEMEGIEPMSESGPSNDLAEQTEPGVEGSEELVEKARNCQVSCSLSGLRCAAAPEDRVGGFGSTSFIGGCDKCYKRAVADAKVTARDVFEGCAAVNCVNLSCD